MTPIQYQAICSRLDTLVVTLKQSAATCHTTCYNFYQVYSSILQKIKNGNWIGASNISDGNSIGIITAIGVFNAAVNNHDHQLMMQQHNLLLPFLP